MKKILPKYFYVDLAIEHCTLDEIKAARDKQPKKKTGRYLKNTRLAKPKPAEEENTNTKRIKIDSADELCLLPTVRFNDELFIGQRVVWYEYNNPEFGVITKITANGELTILPVPVSVTVSSFVSGDQLIEYLEPDWECLIPEAKSLVLLYKRVRVYTACKKYVRMTKRVNV